MKLKVYVIDLEIPARTKRRALLVGIPLCALLGGAAIVYAGVPNVFMAGDPLSATTMNQNFSALDARITALEGDHHASYVWSWEDTVSDIAANASNEVASITFTPPDAGFALVTAHYGTSVRNGYASQNQSDCHITTQLSLTGGQTPDPSQPGYQDLWVNAGVPTTWGPSQTYLDFNQSTSVVVPVTAAPTTVWLNGLMNAGTTGCVSTTWRSITLTAIYFQNNPTATGATY